MLFNWDESKREKTLRERAIDFIDAALVWEDPNMQALNANSIRRQRL